MRDRERDRWGESHLKQAGVWAGTGASDEVPAPRGPSPVLTVLGRFQPKVRGSREPARHQHWRGLGALS